MAGQLIGEVRIFPSGVLPSGWIWCDGQSLPVSSYSNLYSVIGTTYGGDSTNFAVPDLRGRAPLGGGQGPGLTSRTPGESGGAETVALTEGQLPPHSHNLVASSTGNVDTPGPTVTLADAASGSAYTMSGTLVEMGDILASAGDGAPHNNLQPYLTLRFAIAYEGDIPQPN
jgi:microcystin-dependent protein